jgi:MFS family permease
MISLCPLDFAECHFLLHFSLLSLRLATMSQHESENEGDIAMVELELPKASSSKVHLAPDRSASIKTHRSSFSTQTGARLDVIERVSADHIGVDPFYTNEDVSQAQISTARSRIVNNPFRPETEQGSIISTHTELQPTPRAEPSRPNVQQRPTEIPNLTAEITFILVCSLGQLLFGAFTGNFAGLQLILVDMLQIPDSQIPWLIGSFLLANGLSVIISGPMADICRPKYLICGAFAWQTLWNIIGIFSLKNKYLFFITRGGQGLSIGVLVSASISVLGRIYQPGLRKTRVFSVMAAMAPLGYWLGTLQGGALYHHPRLIFATSAIISGLGFASGMYAIPNIRPSNPNLGFRSFDYIGSCLAVTGCALLVAGLTQGPSANWQPYTIVIVVLGLASLVAFFFVERKVQRPLLPPALWKVPGFTPLIISYL